MAYLRDLKNPCSERGCSSNATVELVNMHNATMGQYCRRHGSARLRELNKREAPPARED